MVGSGQMRLPAGLEMAGNDSDAVSLGLPPAAHYSASQQLLSSAHCGSLALRPAGSCPSMLKSKMAGSIVKM
jgi:hypothetical protein